MQKNSSLTLTPEEMKKIQGGDVPDRIKYLWGLTLPELKAKIASGEYVVVEDSTRDDGFGF